MNAPTYSDPVEKMLNRQQFENKADAQNAENAGCETDPALCGGFGKKGNRLNTYRNYQQGYETQQANHANFQASKAGSQLSSGSAFDTTLDRYSPNVAQVINF